jgi:hypothetical protein
MPRSVIDIHEAECDSRTMPGLESTTGAGALAPIREAARMEPPWKEPVPVVMTTSSEARFSSLLAVDSHL